MIARLAAALLGCADPLTDLDPQPIACADPAAREVGWFDTVVLPGEVADTHRFWGAGLAALDADLDGDPDLLIPGPHSGRLLLNDGRGGFADGPAPPGDYERAVGASVADLDGDGDVDAYVSRWGPPGVLLRNDAGALTDVTVAAGLDVVGHAQSSAWADVDLDGDLDLLVAGHGPIDDSGDQIVIPGPGDPSRLWLNDGTGTFSDGSAWIPQRMHDAYTFVVTFAALDDDLVPDLLMSNDYPVWESGLAALGGSSEFAVDASLGLNVRAAGMGLAAGDWNDDGIEDFIEPVWDRLEARASNGDVWVDVSEPLGLVLPPRAETWVGWGAELADLDLDGDLDAVVAFGHLDVASSLTAGGVESANALDQPGLVYVNGGGTFAERTAEIGLDWRGASRGFVVADLDGNGFPDIARRDLDGPITIHLARCDASPWLAVSFADPVAAVGAVVELTAGGAVQRRTVRAGGTSLASATAPHALFGIGDDAIESLDVVWRDGARTSVPGALPRTSVVVER